MNKKRKNTSDRVYKALFNTARCICTNPECNYDLGSEAANIGEAAHICAASPGGPRYDPNQSQEERDGIDNLILLCRNCHRKIDDPNTSEQYPVERLRNWKSAHIARCNEMIAREFTKVSVENLDRAAAKIIQKGTTFQDSFQLPSFDLTSLCDKMERNEFSPQSETTVRIALSLMNPVNEFINEHESEGDFEFHKRIKAGILSIYHGCISKGFSGDDLFCQMIETLLQGIQERNTQTAIIALAVCYMERCDLFSE